MRQIDITFCQKNCEVHGADLSLPCPWPDCKNSIEEDEFEGGIAPGKKFKYIRRKWQSHLGEYYSWDKLNIPNWFSVKQVFWNEARRHNLVPNKHPEIVYHYTSLEALISIIENRSVWMTDYEYLNDRQELNHGIALVSESIDKMLERGVQLNVQELLIKWKDKIKKEPSRICITSFSSDGDSLSQWRAYGPVAIGFSVKNLLLHVEDGIFQHVEYDFATQEKLVEIYLTHLVNAFVVDTKEDRLGEASDLYHKNEHLLDFITFFKNPAFRSESEYRLAYINKPEILSTFNLSNPPKYFRVSNGRIIPYVPSTSILLSGEESYPLEIKEIIIGPENDELLEKGISELLSVKGLSEVSIRKSIVPLRK
ncbi:DUF2971 domain-containing protein [Vibrio vulnificus]|uniref:DUF2971 domain-containing protein n=1 Tax=Vibrio vulnificus TaxID=672 RepID=UPI001029BDFF|nr:DUF2971 domain-containing protein [Vibrio vulnificus]EHU4998383.1 DUF2971 domain-containing protein [Vibrio vulnificus]RZR33961.1 DUF2971 domain-containing protein [Vibrio vulnificus]